MLALALSALSPAHACGGFFCSQSDPVVQNAERIVFAVDEEEGWVETHVQVEYEGPADQFAWIVPVQAPPELFLSTDALFDRVGSGLQPQHRMEWVDEGKCREPIHISLPCPGCSYEASIDMGDADPRDSGVDVVATDVVGPYETVTLQADDIGSLMGWLDENGYDIPSNAAESIAPYISDDGYFLALKLTKGSDAGDLAPLGMRYAGDRPAIPLQLTAVASAPDLRLEVTIFGSRRAVPENYLHVEVNDAAIDWFNGGANYLDVITRAADEAGGQAFATDYAGSPDILGEFWTMVPDPDPLNDASSPTEWVQGVQSSGLVGSADVLDAFRRAVPVAPGFEEVDVYNCPSCFTGWYAGPPWDPVVATDILIERVIEPREQVEEMIDTYAYVTRLTSSISASEMTLDPTFVFNDTMGDVERDQLATLVFECNGRYRRKASRRLELPSGLAVMLPSQKWFEKNDMTESEYLAELGAISAGKIEATGTGEPEVLVDLSGELADQIDLFNAGAFRGACGCGTADPRVPGVLALLGLFGLRRRRSVS